MKNIILLFAFAFFLGNNSFAQGIQFDKGNWQEIMAKAESEDKLIFVDAYASWCGPCKKMARNVFTKPQVGEFFNAKFVNAKIDMEKGEGANLARKWKVRAYPTLLFLNSAGEVVHQAIGYHNSDLLIELGEAALDPDRNSGSISKKYAAGDRSPKLLYNYALAKFDAMDESYIETAEEYLGTQSDWNNDLNREFIYRMVNDLDSKMARHMVDNLSAYKTQLGEQAMAGKIDELVQNKVAYAENENDLKAVENFYNKIYPGKGSEMSGQLKMGYYAQKEDWTNFANAANAHYKKHNAESWDELNEIAWMFYEIAEGKKNLKSALAWAKKSVKMDNNYFNNDTVAALYYRLGKKGKAKKAAQKAIALAKAAGEDHSATDLLLDNINKM